MNDVLSKKNEGKTMEKEKNSWKYLLDSFTENILSLKERLNDLVKASESSSHEILAEIEFFQNRLLQSDTLIAFLRAEISAYEKLLLRKVELNDEIIKQQKKLSREIKLSEQSMQQLAADLKSYFELRK